MIIHSDNFYIKESQLGGQGLFAKKYIPRGSIILKEKHLSCIRTFVSSSDDINSYFDFPELCPPPGCHDSLTLLGSLMKKIVTLENKYGIGWYNNLYRENDSKKVIKSLEKQQHKYICELCVKYQPKGGFDTLIDIYNVVRNNYFTHYKFSNNRPLYSCLDYISSKFNHSCKQNCHYITFPKHTIIITIDDIKTDTELTIGYGSKMLEYSNINCKCGFCNENDNYLMNNFNHIATIEMLKREISDQYIECSFNSSEGIQKYLNDKNRSKCLIFQGFEIWYHLLYDTMHRNKNLLGANIYGMCAILLLEYMKDMAKTQSQQYNIDETEALVYFMLTTEKFCHIFIDGFFKIMDLVRPINLSYNHGEDLFSLLKNMH